MSNAEHITVSPQNVSYTLGMIRKGAIMSMCTVWAPEYPSRVADMVDQFLRCPDDGIGHR
jgi:hypothetical protein